MQSAAAAKEAYRSTYYNDSSVLMVPTPQPYVAEEASSASVLPTVKESFLSVDCDGSEEPPDIDWEGSEDEAL